jgi:hypothetical protein
MGTGGGYEISLTELHTAVLVLSVSTLGDTLLDQDSLESVGTLLRSGHRTCMGICDLPLSILPHGATHGDLPPFRQAPGALDPNTLPAYQ